MPGIITENRATTKNCRRTAFHDFRTELLFAALSYQSCARPVIFFVRPSFLTAT
jgi:hypothetical protein